MAREPIRSYQNQLMNYGIGRAFADNKPVTRGQMAQAAIPEDPRSLLDNLRRLKMAGGLSRASEIVPNQAFSLPEDIFEATETVVGAGAVEPVDLGTGRFAPDGTPLGEPGTKIIPEGPKKPTPARIMGAGDEAAAQAMIAEKEKEAAQKRVDSVIDAKMNKDAIAGLLGDSGSPEKTAAVEDAFLGGMSEYYKALAQDVPEVGDRKELLQKYMQEFSEATGIPIGDKIDKSQALMALGLGLMQNRAGKGFNVGRMLSSVGEAGQAAMPYLTKAKDEAKQARIAAGKYALQKIESDESAVDAIKSANRALYNDLALENMKHKNAMEKEILKAELEGNESKKIEALKSVGDLKIRIGSQDIILKRGANVEDEGRVVWQDPVGDAKNIATAYRKTTGGLNSIARMNELLDLMAAEAEGQVGGTAVQGLLDKAKEVAVSVGMDLGPYTGGEDVSPRVQYEKLSNALLANFKRYLTSETGNGISTYDVQQIQAALGKFGTFDDIKGAKMALNEIMPMFTHSLSVLEPLVEDFSDRNQYRAGVAGDEQYDDVMSFFSREFGKTSLIQPTQVTRDDGTVVTEYDVSY